MRDIKERIHNIKYYLKQIGIYLEGEQYRKIGDVLSELQIEIHKEEKDLICSNRFLNALLIDYKRGAKKIMFLQMFLWKQGLRLNL